MSEKKQERIREEKLEAGELNAGTIREKLEKPEENRSEFEKKLSNFWYYNKWKVIVALGVIVLITVTTLQMCGVDKVDIDVLYSGSHYMENEQRAAFENALSVCLPADFNGDGQKSAALSVINVYSNEQVAELNEKAKTDAGCYPVNIQVNQQSVADFGNLMMTGEYSVCILEPWLYDRIAKSGGVRRLKDVLGTVPENAFSDFAVYLKDTALYRDNPGLFDGFTDNTLVCLRTRSQVGTLFDKEGGSEEYANAERYFACLVLGN